MGKHLARCKGLWIVVKKMPVAGHQTTTSLAQIVPTRNFTRSLVTMASFC